jgi:hypothetical protein
VPKNALVAVLSAAPGKAKKGTSWIGSPPVELRRSEVEADAELTYRPSTRLRRLRGFWETLRLLSVVAARSSSPRSSEPSWASTPSSPPSPRRCWERWGCSPSPAPS